MLRRQSDQRGSDEASPGTVDGSVTVTAEEEDGDDRDTDAAAAGEGRCDGSRVSWHHEQSLTVDWPS